MIISLRFPAIVICSVLSSAPVIAAEIPKPPDPSRGGVNNIVAQLRAGATRIVNPDDKPGTEANHKAIKMAAQYMAFSIASPPFNGEPEPREAPKLPGERTMSSLMTEVVEKYLTLTPQIGENNRLKVEQIEYGLEMGTEVAAAAKIVLDNSTRGIERVNAVRLMSHAAKMPCPPLADALSDILANPKESESLKYYAAQGLKNILEQSDSVDPSKHIIRDQAKLVAIAKSISNYITAKREPRDEREFAVIQFVRREAVAAMARFRDGVIRKPNKDVLFRPAWTLMRVIEMDPVAFPPFTIQERIEAASGFGNMRIDAEMNLDVAAYSVAKVLVDFARDANLDYQRIQKEKTLSVLPWKVAAARLSLSQATWSQTAKALGKARGPESITSLADEAIRMLNPIEKDGSGAQTNSNAITTWAVSNQPKAWAETPPQPALLFKDDKDSVLPFGVMAKLETPKK